MNLTHRNRLSSAAMELSEIQDLVDGVAKAERDKSLKIELKSIASRIETLIDDLQAVVQ